MTNLAHQTKMQLINRKPFFEFNFIIILICFFSCSNRKINEEFHQNGKLRIQFESVNGIKDGVLNEYDSNGTLRYVENWKDGVLNGPFKEYYSSGEILREGIINEGKTVNSTIFYENGNVFKNEILDLNGALFELEVFNKDGARVSVPIPIAKIHDVKFGDKAVLRCRIMNLVKPVDSLGNGQLIITNGFLNVPTYEIAKDTIAIITPINDRDFYYEFTPKNKGVNKLFGVLTYIKKGDKTSTVILNEIEEEFMVY